MKPKQLYILTTLLICVILQLNAQTIPGSTDSSSISGDSLSLHNNEINSKDQHQFNFIKTNITGLILNNYSLQYERVLSKSIAIAFSFRTMPESGVPFKKLILNSVGNDDPDIKKTIDNVRLSNSAFTPEIRFYLSKTGYGKGFYIAPFYRYATFKVSNLPFTYQTSSNTESDVNLSGKFTSNTGGFMIGVQKFLGKHICLDIWIFGPHYGSGSGNFVGVVSQPLTQPEQDDIRQQLEDLDIPLTKKTINVNANGASLKLNGPWAGLRSGLSFGVKF